MLKCHNLFWQEFSTRLPFWQNMWIAIVPFSSVSKNYTSPHCKASVDDGTWYIFWKLWPIAFSLLFWKYNLPKCVFLKCMFVKFTQFTYLLSFASLFFIKVFLIPFERGRREKDIFWQIFQFSFQFEKTGEVWVGQRMKGGIIHDSDLVSHFHQKRLCRANFLLQKRRKKLQKNLLVRWGFLGVNASPLWDTAGLPPLPSVAILNHRSQDHQPLSTPLSKVERHRR